MEYQVRQGKSIEHAGIYYPEGAIVELTTELAVFHEPNIETIPPAPGDLGYPGNLGWGRLSNLPKSEEVSDD